MKNIQLEHHQNQIMPTKHPLCLLAHDIESPANIGSLFRLADALGIEKLYISGSSPTPPNRKVKKTARSTEKVVDYSYEESPFRFIQTLKDSGYTIISLEITTKSIDIRDLNIGFDEKVCLILGSENRGVNQQLLDLSDKTVHIPMFGRNSSMNVVSACSIAAFEIIKNFKSQSTP